MSKNIELLMIHYTIFPYLNSLDKYHLYLSLVKHDHEHVHVHEHVLEKDDDFKTSLFVYIHFHYTIQNNKFDRKQYIVLHTQNILDELRKYDVKKHYIITHDIVKKSDENLRSIFMMKKKIIMILKI